MLSGCASATIEDAVPTAATQPNVLPATAPAPTAAQATATTVPATSVETAASGGPKDTGTFPNLNIKPQAAHEQLTPEQKAAEIQALQAAQSAQAAKTAEGETTTDPEVLRKLAATHADDALKAIEGQ